MNDKLYYILTSVTLLMLSIANLAKIFSEKVSKVFIILSILAIIALTIFLFIKK